MNRFLTALALGIAASAVSAQDTIKIGVITDRVGVSKPYSEPATEGVIFGAEEINRKGGILGKKIELLVEDDQSRPDISAALARKLVDQGAVFILSVSLSPATQQQQTVTMEAKTPQMTMSACSVNGAGVVQLGARLHYAVPRILHEAGQLTQLFTDFSAGSSLPREGPEALEGIPPIYPFGAGGGLGVLQNPGVPAAFRARSPPNSAALNTTRNVPKG